MTIKNWKTLTPDAKIERALLAKKEETWTNTKSNQPVQIFCVNWKGIGFRKSKKTRPTWNPARRFIKHHRPGHPARLTKPGPTQTNP